MANRIAVLDGAVADQIAAGEVVERPASVVKELVENALDAGATVIDIEVVDGGREGIRVSDNGCGMDRDDAVLALERHATSKIRLAEDLVGVRSFGFRGEALPAICSVSELTITTAPTDGAGTEVQAAVGAVRTVQEAARRQGTTIHVTRIFHNAPARRKFMKGNRSEWRSVMETLTALSLTRRKVRFTLSTDSKAPLVLPVAATLGDRLAALFGGPYAARFLPVDDVSGSTQVSGLVERPAEVGTASRRVHIAINGRAIRDNGIVRAAEAAYRTTIPSGVRPSLFLEIEIAGDAVDVNVHPAKAEVRFRDRWQLERVVETAVRRALGTVNAAASIGRSYWPLPSSSPVPMRTVDVETLQPHAAPMDGFFAAPEVADTVSETIVAAVEGDVPLLTQLRHTYMMFEHDEGVVLIDQHSAHERVLFERFMRVLAAGEAPAQRLLFPMTLHLSADEADAFDSARESFERLGFEIEGFGGQTLIVRSVPMPHPRFDAERCLRETLAALAGDRSASAHGRHEKLAATVACKAAIKAGDTMSPREMRALFVALRDTTLPAHDVHGRSTIVQLPWDEIERRFGRR